VRELLRAGHDPNALERDDDGSDMGRICFFLAVRDIVTDSATTPDQLDARLQCIEVMVREGEADINARDSTGETLLHCFAWWHDPEHRPGLRATLGLLLRLGANINARNSRGRTPIYRLIKFPDLLQFYFDHGASADVVDDDGWTPLTCAAQVGVGESALMVLRRSSMATRRACLHSRSALDWLIKRHLYDPQPWMPKIAAKLLLADVPFLPHNAHVLLALLALHLQQHEERMAALDAGDQWDWRGHDEMVQLALDMRDMLELEALVAQREALVRRLEEEDRELDAVAAAAEAAAEAAPEEAAAARASEGKSDDEGSGKSKSTGKGKRNKNSKSRKKK
jgi:hypothetical protein